MLTTLAFALAVQTPAKLPADLVGEWRYTTIRGTSYYDRTNGSYLGHAGGNSDTLKLSADGTYQEYVYIENSPSAGWTTKIFTTTKGKATIEDGKLVLTPTEGHYKTEDNRVAKYNIDRDMTPEEVKKGLRTYPFRLDTDNGKPVLLLTMGKSEIKYRSTK
ncbi:hypothetical protein EON82_06550 [bacterium]|nr:MAG: hypothetical protein EON82_06550 [bacterium]